MVTSVKDFLSFLQTATDFKALPLRLGFDFCTQHLDEAAVASRLWMLQPEALQSATILFVNVKTTWPEGQELSQVGREGRHGVYEARAGNSGLWAGGSAEAGTGT